MDEKTAYRRKLEARLDQWRAEIDKLRARAVEAGADASLEYRKQIDRLHGRQEAARDRLKEIDEASGEAWKDLRAGLEKAWDDLESAVSQARKRFG